MDLLRFIVLTPVPKATWRQSDSCREKLEAQCYMSKGRGRNKQQLVRRKDSFTGIEVNSRRAFLSEGAREFCQHSTNVPLTVLTPTHHSISQQEYMSTYPLPSILPLISALEEPCTPVRARGGKQGARPWCRGGGLSTPKACVADSGLSSPSPVPVRNLG